MLKPTPGTAQRFLANAEVRSHLSEWNPLQYMWHLL